MTPGKRVIDNDTATVTWTVGDTEIVRTLNVTVSRLAVAPTLATQGFRVEEDQKQAVLKDANEQLRTAIKKLDEDFASDADYYTDVTFANYPATGEASNVSVTFAHSSDSGVTEVYANYAITDPSTVNVEAMVSSKWEDVSGLTLSGTTGTDNHAVQFANPSDADATWLRGTPTAAWTDHELAFGTAQVPTDASKFSGEAIALNAGDGKHEVNLYAKDSNNVVSQITCVTYKVDTLAPSLQSYEVGEPYTVHDNIFFARDQFDVDLSVVDAVKGGATGEDGVANVTTTASGVKTDAIKASYHDDEANADHNDVSATQQGDGIYSFTVSGDQDIETDSIKVYMEDVAGNYDTVNANDAEAIPMEYVRLVSDASAPTISTSWDTTAAANGRYYNTNRTLTLTIEEPFFEYVQKYRNDQVVTTIAHDDYVVAVHPSDFQQVGENTWQYSYSFTVDADWTVSNPQITDIVDRSATSTGDSFTIDKTAPTMDVTFNATTDNGYYNAARVATITVTEHNFDPSLVTINTTVAAGNGSEAAPAQVGGWTSNGDIHTATVTFPGQGVYTMSIEGTDLALNALPSYSCPEFTVDTLTPEITLSGDVAAHADTRYAYAGDAGLGVAVHDTNIDGTRTTINVEKLSTPSDVNPYTANQTQTATDITKSFQNPSDITRDNDGVYRLTVQAVDLAGNTADQSVLWSVNRYGSTYVISADSEELLNTFTNADDLVDIQVTEINVDTLNDDATAVELSRDTTSSTLARDDDYTVDHGQNESTGWQEYVYTVDQAAYSEDGAYRLLFHSEDSAANVSENTMPGKLSGGDADDTAEVAFGVDSTAPVVSFVGTLDADTYQQASVPVTVNIEDNLALDHAQIIVNDEVVREIGSDELQGASNSFEFEVPESGERQSVRVVAYDVAGNETTQERSDLLINSNPFIQLINNTPLLIGCVVVIAAAIGGGVYLVGKRKKDEEK